MGNGPPSEEEEEDDIVRMSITLAVVVIWATIEVVAALGLGAYPPKFNYIRMAICLLLLKKWNIEPVTLGSLLK